MQDAGSGKPLTTPNLRIHQGILLTATIEIKPEKGARKLNVISPFSRLFR